MNAFDLKEKMYLQVFLTACKAQAWRFSSGCGLRDQPSAVAIWAEADDT